MFGCIFFVLCLFSVETMFSGSCGVFVIYLLLALHPIHSGKYQIQASLTRLADFITHVIIQSVEGPTLLKVPFIRYILIEYLKKITQLSQELLLYYKLNIFELLQGCLTVLISVTITKKTHRKAIYNTFASFGVFHSFI